MEIAISWHVFIFLMLVLNPPQEYRPYQRKSRWRKLIECKLAGVSKQFKAIAFDAYLYFIAHHKKNEANLRKGRQRSNRYNYHRMKRGRALMQMILLHAVTGTQITRGTVTQNTRNLIPQPIAEYLFIFKLPHLEFQIYNFGISLSKKSQCYTFLRKGICFSLLIV